MYRVPPFLQICEELGLTEDASLPVLEDLGEDFVDEKGDFWDDDLIDKLADMAEKAEEDADDHQEQVKTRTKMGRALCSKNRCQLQSGLQK